MQSISRILFALVVFCGIIPAAFAQTVVSTNLLLSDATTGHSILLKVPALTGSLELTMPTTPGTLLVNQGAGVSNAWLLGGNDLSSAGPSENRIGTTTAQDVELIAGGDVKLRLGSSGTLTATDGTKLAFQDDDESNVSSFVAGNQTNDIAYTLPTATPSINQVLTATAVSGNDVTLGWANGAGAATITSTLATTYSFADSETLTDVPNFSVALAANTTYEISILLFLDKTAGDRKIRFVLNGPTGSYCTLHVIDQADDKGKQTTTNANDNYSDDVTVLLHGVVRTFSTAGDFKVGVSLTNDNLGIDSWDVIAGSSIVAKPF